MIWESSDLSYLIQKPKLVWKIEKKYEEPIFTDDSRSCGYPIDVYVDSIGKQQLNGW